MKLPMFRFFCILFLCHAQWVFAQADCDAVFSDAAQTHKSGGKLDIKNNAKIINSPDNILDTDNIDASTLSCVSVDCTASGAPSATGIFSSFPGGATLNIVSSQTIAPGDYDELVVDDGVSVILTPGDYTFRNKFEVKKNAMITVQGGGTVRIYVDNNALFKDDSALVLDSAADTVFVYATQKIEMDKRVNATGVFYATQEFKADDDSTIVGSVAGEKVTLEDRVTVTYDEALRDDTDFDGFCDQGPDAFIDIVVAPTASTCVAHDVTVRICADIACTALNTDYIGTINLTTSTNNGDWSESLASGILVPGAADSGAATFEFETGNAGTATLQLADSRAEQLSITATDAVDVSITDTSDTVIFGDNALVVDDIDSLTEGAGGADLAVSGRAHRYRVQFVRRDTSQSPANCAVASNYSNAAQPLKAWITRSAQLTAAADPQIGALTLPESQPLAANLNLDFSSGGVAFFNLATTDVGQYSIALLDDSRVFASNADVAGSSNQLTVRPFAFDIDIEIAGVEDRATNGSSGNSYAANALGSVFVNAGSSFTVELSAVQWQAADDANDDGLADTGANLADNPLVLSFGQEISAAQATLTHSLVAPAGGSAGSLSGSSFSGFATGQSRRSDVSWDEVGIVDLSANLVGASYLASGSSVSGALSNLGRFIPASFSSSAVVLSEACASGAFTYMGDIFNVTYNLEALNTSGAVTTNYRDAFIKLDSSQGTLNYGAIDLASTTNLSARLQPDGASFNAASTFIWGPASGLALGTAEIDTRLILQRDTAPDGQYTASIGVLAVDTDASSSAPLNLDVDGGGDDYASLATTTQRYGRVFIENAFGPETRDLDLPLLAEFFLSTLLPAAGFVPNLSDSCTSMSIGDFSEVAGSYTLNLDAVDTDPVAVSSANFVAGKGAVTMSAPGAGNDGSVDIEFSLPGHLRYDWDENPGSADENPQNTATFGSFRGNDRVIYRRELLQ